MNQKMEKIQYYSNEMDKSNSKVDELMKKIDQREFKISDLQHALVECRKFLKNEKDKRNTEKEL